MKHSDLLNRVASQHSYEEGFNGQLGLYRNIMFDRIISAIGPRASVLEIGAGEGAVTQFLQQKFQSLTAIEPAEKFYERLQSRFCNTPGIVLINELFETFAFKKQFDLIVAAGVLEHVEDPVHFLVKARELLSDGGKLLLTVPNARSMHRRIGLKMGLIAKLDQLSEQDFQVGHLRYYDMDLLKNHLQQSGLKVNILQGFFLKPFPNDQMVQLSANYLDALFRLSEDLPEWGAEIFSMAERG